jgi:peptide chain release factor subunit 1
LAEADGLLESERVQRIVHFHGGGIPVVSMYVTIPAAPGDLHARALSAADSLLHELRPRADDRTLDHRARRSLRADIENIEAVLASASGRPGTLAILSCSGAGLLEVVWLPRAARDEIVVDEIPWTRPMLAVLEEYRRCFAVLVDRESAHAWELYLGRIRDAGPLLHSHESRGANLAAVNERRNPHKAEELEKRRFRLYAGALEDLLADDADAVLTLGGHDQELSHLVELLAHPLQQRVAGTFAADNSTATAGTVLEQAEAVLERYELDRQRRRVAELLDSADVGGRAAAGLDRCLWAGSMAAVHELYVQEGATAPGVVCDRSRWLALSGERCPICGEQTRETPDVIEELTHAVIDEGGSVHHVRAETELSQLRVACSLWFELSAGG